VLFVKEVDSRVASPISRTFMVQFVDVFRILVLFNKVSWGEVFK